MLATWPSATTKRLKTLDFEHHEQAGIGEFPEREAFDTLLEAKVLIERWRQHYNTIRPHSALGYRPPAPEALQPCVVAAAAPPQPHRPGLLEGKTP